MNDLVSGAINIENVAHTITPIFSNRCRQRKKKLSNHPTLLPQSQTSSVPKGTKQTVDPTSPPSDRQTPDQLNHPINSTFSGETDESTDKENTKILFVSSSMSDLDEEI